MMNLYAKCGKMARALNIFKGMVDRRTASWNIVLQGYVENGESEVALKLFSEMDEARDVFTYVASLTACSALAAQHRDRRLCWLETGRAVHQETLMNQCSSELLDNALISMYSTCGSIFSARIVFDGMMHQTTVSWNALLQGYFDNGESELALELFLVDLQENQADSRTYVAALSACSSLVERKLKAETGRLLNLVREIHSRAVKRKLCDSFVENSLIHSYSSCNSTADARAVFDSMACRGVVSWNALITGHLNNGENELALALVQKMDLEKDGRTYAAALTASGNLMNLELGRHFHAEIKTLKLDENDVVLGNHLVDFYSKCGSMEEAREVFDSMRVKTRVSWNSLLSGYSSRGDAQQVFELFERMEDSSSCAPDEVSLVCYLSACVHAGLVDKGRECFEGMKLKYGVEPDEFHYSCLVELLGRANRMNEALRVVQGMPLRPSVVVWRSLLGACWKWKDFEVGKVAYEALLSLDEEEASAHVLMANLDETSCVD